MFFLSQRSAEKPLLGVSYKTLIWRVPFLIQRIRRLHKCHFQGSSELDWFHFPIQRFLQKNHLQLWPIRRKSSNQSWVLIGRLEEEVYFVHFQNDPTIVLMFSNGCKCSKLKLCKRNSASSEKARLCLSRWVEMEVLSTFRMWESFSTFYVGRTWKPHFQVSMRESKQNWKPHGEHWSKMWKYNIERK